MDFLTKILIKASGDLTSSKQFLDFVKEKAGNGFESKYVVVICGGGTKISAALKKAGYPIKFDSLNRRIVHSLEEQKIMEGVLQEEQLKLSHRFLQADILNLNVVMPILYAGLTLCPINGDDLVKAYSLGFDEIYVLTKPERVEKKQAAFKDYPNIEIVGIHG